MRRLGIAGVIFALVVLASACGGGANHAGERRQLTQTTAPSTAEAPSPTSTPTDAELWDKAIPVGRSQVREGLELTLTSIALTTPSKVISADEQEQFAEAYPNTKAIVVVMFDVYNRTATTASLPVYTSTTALVNDEQVDMDFMLSDVETEILSGARQQMSATFIVTRYAPSEIQRVRFVLQKTISFTLPESETTYDFTVQVR